MLRHRWQRRQGTRRASSALGCPWSCNLTPDHDGDDDGDDDGDGDDGDDGDDDDDLCHDCRAVLFLLHPSFQKFLPLGQRQWLDKISWKLQQRQWLDNLSWKLQQRNTVLKRNFIIVVSKEVSFPVILASEGVEKYF